MLQFVSKVIAFLLAILLIVINFFRGIPGSIKKPVYTTEPETTVTQTLTETEPQTTCEPTTVTTTQPTTVTTTQRETTTVFRTAPSQKTTAEKGTIIRAVNENGMRMFGGKGIDVFNGADGYADGFYACGVTTSSSDDMQGNTGTSTSSNGSFIASFDTSMNKKWNYIVCKSGGTVYLTDVAILSDGNIVAVGYSNAPCYISGSGFENTFEAIILKLSPEGELIWEKSFGGSGSDKFNCVCAVGDGFAVGGSVTSSDGSFDGLPKEAAASAVIMIFDADGKILRNRYLSGNRGASIDGIASDKYNNIFVTCITNSVDGEFAAISGLYGDYNDTVVLKYDYSGNNLWHYVIASSGKDEFPAIEADNEGGCLVGGSYGKMAAPLPDGTFSGTHYYGEVDAFVFRINPDGTRKWIKGISGMENDYIYDIVRVKGGYAAVGATASSDSDFSGRGNFGGTDGFICLITPGGATAATYTQGGSRDDYATCAAVCGAYNVAALGKSVSNDGYFSGYNTHLTDGFIEIAGNAFTGYISRYMMNAY